MMDIKKLFSWIFLFIFFMKMVITAAPLISDHLRADSLNAVIMQLEIEQETSKEEVKLKAVNWYSHPAQAFNFFDQPLELLMPAKALDAEKHHRIFYPRVPTPPPNA